MAFGEIIGEIAEAAIGFFADSSIKGKDKVVGFFIFLGVVGIISLVVYLI